MKSIAVLAVLIAAAIVPRVAGDDYKLEKAQNEKDVEGMIKCLAKADLNDQIMDSIDEYILRHYEKESREPNVAAMKMVFMKADVMEHVTKLLGEERGKIFYSCF